ncbi:MAG: hypothetical protein JWQ96_3289 [Segetibacter sp.]|nr:hypothetical protein [Segetibacter sp.]
MKIRNALLLFFLAFLACKNKSDEKSEEKFDKIKWATKQDREYTYRDKMLADFMTSYKLNGVPKDSVLSLLGQPLRSENGYLYYIVDQKFLPNTYFPISTKSLVIKLTKDSTVEWRKIHE